MTLDRSKTHWNGWHKNESVTTPATLSVRLLERDTVKTFPSQPETEAAIKIINLQLNTGNPLHYKCFRTLQQQARETKLFQRKKKYDIAATSAVHLHMRRRGVNVSASSDPNKDQMIWRCLIRSTCSYSSSDVHDMLPPTKVHLCLNWAHSYLYTQHNSMWNQCNFCCNSPKYFWSRMLITKHQHCELMCHSCYWILL